MPSGIVAGNLLFVIFSTDGDNTVTNWNGFTELFSASNGTASSLHIGYKIAVGSDTLTITTSDSEEGSYVIFRIIDHDSSSNPPEASAGATGDDVSPNPDQITMGVSKDYMFIACEGSDHLDIVTAYPSTHTQNRHTQNGGASGSCGVGVATREYTGTVDDPGVFTLAAGEQWVACTVAVHPVAGASHSYDTMKGDAKVEQHSFGTMKGDAKVEQHSFGTMKGDAKVQEHGFNADLAGNAKVEAHSYVTMAGNAVVAYHGFDTMKGGAIVKGHSYGTLKGDAKVEQHSFDTMKGGAIVKAHDIDTMKGDAKVEAHSYVTMKGDAPVVYHSYGTMAGDVIIEAHGFNADLAGGVKVQAHGFDPMKGDAKVQAHGFGTMQGGAQVEAHSYGTMAGNAIIGNHGFDPMAGGAVIEEHSYATMKGNAIVQSAGGAGGRKTGSSKSIIIKPS